MKVNEYRKLIHQLAMDKIARKDDDEIDSYVINSFAEEFEMSYADAKKKVFRVEHMDYVVEVMNEYERIFESDNRSA